MEERYTRRLGTLDLKVLHLAFRKGGTFDERDIADSELNDLGVGRILDVLAVLKDRSMIQLNSNQTFTMTKSAREILWSNTLPIQTKILRLLQIRSCSIDDITNILGVSSDKVIDSLTKLRERQLVLMSPQRRSNKLVKIYEILPKGVMSIDTGKIDGFDIDTTQNLEIHEIIDQIRDMIKDSQISDSQKTDILEKIIALKSRLDI